MKKKGLNVILVFMFFMILIPMNACSEEVFRIAFEDETIKSGHQSYAVIEQLKPNITITEITFEENAYGINRQEDMGFGFSTPPLSFEEDGKTVLFKPTSNCQGWLKILYRDENNQMNAYLSERVSVTEGIQVEALESGDLHFTEEDYPTCYVYPGGSFTIKYIISGGSGNKRVEYGWNYYAQGTSYSEKAETGESVITASITATDKISSFGYYISIEDENGCYFYCPRGVAVTVIDNALWSEPKYIWSEDNTSVSAYIYYEVRIVQGGSINFSFYEKETVKTQLEIVPETETEDGKKIYKAEFSKPMFETQIKEIVIPATGHDLIKHDRVNPSCTEQGIEAYWSCNICNKLFSDADGIIEISSPVIIQAIGHIAVVDSAVAPTYESTGLTEGSHCSVCGTIIVAQQEIPRLEPEPTEEPVPVIVTEVTINGGKYVLDLEKEEATLIGVEDADITKLTIPASVAANDKQYKVTAIKNNACKGLKKLSKVTIGANVRSIGNNAFASCGKLKSVSGMKGVSTIGNSAFQKCIALTKITLQKQVEKIGKNAFSGCKALKTITLKATKLKSIGKKAFSGIVDTATFKCPKGLVEEYTKLIRKAGSPEKAVIK